VIDEVVTDAMTASFTVCQSHPKLVVASITLRRNLPTSNADY
jgi:hypothetical protein